MSGRVKSLVSPEPSSSVFSSGPVRSYRAIVVQAVATHTTRCEPSTTPREARAVRAFHDESADRRPHRLTHSDRLRKGLRPATCSPAFSEGSRCLRCWRQVPARAACPRPAHDGDRPHLGEHKVGSRCYGNDNTTSGPLPESTASEPGAPCWTSRNTQFIAHAPATATRHPDTTPNSEKRAARRSLTAQQTDDYPRASMRRSSAVPRCWPPGIAPLAADSTETAATAPGPHAGR